MPSSELALELRAARPHAPEGLRERVRALPEPAPPRSFPRPSLRAALVLASAVVAASLSVAIGYGLINSGGSKRQPQSAEKASPAPAVKRAIQPGRITTPGLKGYTQELAPAAPRSPRLQQYDAWLRLRVKDLSGATKTAMRTARNLDGFVQSASYNAPGNARGESTLVLRIPVRKLPTAIAQLSELGTILGQRVQLQDVTRQVDLQTRQIRALIKQAAQLRSQIAATSDPTRRQQLQQRLDYVLSELTAFQRSRRDTVRGARLAHLSVAFTTRKPAAATPSRLRRTLDDAGGVLAREAEVLLYALVVAGPLLLLGAVLLAAGRTWTRRSDRRLLERT
jgi:hypothetical protein